MGIRNDLPWSLLFAAGLLVAGIAAGCSGQSPSPTAPTPPPVPPPPAVGVTLAGLTLAPARVVAGAPSEGTVTVTPAAPSGGVTVTLASSHPAARVDASVTVPAGSTAATFVVTTTDVASDTSVALVATAGGTLRTVDLEVAAVPRQASGFAIEPDRIRGGETATGRVVLGTFAASLASAEALTAAAPVVVTLTSSHSSVQVPSSVTVPAGATEVTFPIDTTSVSQQVVVVLTASSGGVTRTTGMQVLPTAPTLARIEPSSGTRGTTMQVTLTGSGFLAGDTRAVVRGTPDVVVTNVSVASDTSATATITIASGAAFATHPLFVETGGGSSGSQSFTVRPSSGSQTFNFTGASQSFVVPAGVTSVTVEASGAQGGAGNGGTTGGQGGRTTATIAVTPGEMLAVFVGGQGADHDGVNGAAGGFNGGGNARHGSGPAGAGGGASDVRRGANALADRIVVAGGGGGGGGRAPAGPGGPGGAGGGLTGGAGGDGSGANANGRGGGGGTQAAGGAAGGLNGGPEAGALGTGGTGSTNDAKGGGGGGGYYGGGGGEGLSGFGPEFAAGGGGGGSSFAIGTATNVTHQQGVRAGNGVVVITW